MAQITAHQEFKSMQCDRWEDIPADWHCPVCNTGKAEFNELKF